MSLYYFVKTRFPLLERRNKLREIFDKEGKIPAEIFGDDDYFCDFQLKLPSKLPKETNTLSGLTYESLNELQTQFDLKTIRCVFIRQNHIQQEESTDNDDSILEIFNRLNSGGMNLTPQEIRVSLYHSKFMEMITRLSYDKRWLALANKEEPDLRMSDVEYLLRGFAMLIKGDKYSPSMTRFLNGFAKDMQNITQEENLLLETTLSNFFDACKDLPLAIFAIRGDISISVFESVFATVCKQGYLDKSGYVPLLDESKINQLKNDEGFLNASSTKSTNKANVKTRLEIAQQILLG